jgi:hypothetical protein
MEFLERRIERASRLLALVRNPNEAESKLAADRLRVLINAQPELPVRWFVRPGTVVKVMPTASMHEKGNAQAMRQVACRNQQWFFETHRQRGDVADAAMDRGFMFFERYGYAVFVPLTHLELYL